MREREDKSILYFSNLFIITGYINQFWVHLSQWDRTRVIYWSAKYVADHFFLFPNLSLLFQDYQLESLPPSESQPVPIACGRTRPTKPACHCASSWWSFRQSPSRTQSTSGHAITECTTSLQTQTPIPIMPPEDSSSLTWVGCWSGSIRMWKRKESSSICPTWKRIQWLCSRKSKDITLYSRHPFKITQIRVLVPDTLSIWCPSWASSFPRSSRGSSMERPSPTAGTLPPCRGTFCRFTVLGWSTVRRIFGEWNRTTSELRVLMAHPVNSYFCFNF